MIHSTIQKSTITWNNIQTITTTKTKQYKLISYNKDLRGKLYHESYIFSTTLSKIHEHI